MIYLDNAATGGFKPRASVETAETVMKFLCANPGRSGHRLSVTGERIIFGAREVFSKELNCSANRVIFTKNCTEALNLAIFGTLKVGGHIITTVYEHNSVLRPLYALKKRGLISLDIVEPWADKPLSESIKEKITDDTYLVITTAVSNVTGEVLPVNEIGEMLKGYKIKYLVDGAQGGGHIKLSLGNGINMIAFAGHKGLCGIMTSGVLAFDDNTEIEPVLFGGTGTESYNPDQPATYPERLEAGTLNLPAIASLKEGAEYAFRNLKDFSENLYLSTERIIAELNATENAEVFSLPNPAGIAAFRLKNTPSSEVADILNSEFDIAVRSGLHCAPLLHKFLGTADEGLVRVSLAVQNGSREIDSFLRAIKKIAR